MIAAMKKIKYIIIAIACSMLFLSCDDMLDLTPKSKMTPETFFKNDSEMMAFAMNLYSMFPMNFAVSVPYLLPAAAGAGAPCAM